MSTNPNTNSSAGVVGTGYTSHESTYQQEQQSQSVQQTLASALQTLNRCHDAVSEMLGEGNPPVIGSNSIPPMPGAQELAKNLDMMVGGLVERLGIVRLRLGVL